MRRKPCEGLSEPSQGESSPRSIGAFTLIELLVAMGLMAILLTMIAQIFFQASQSFRIARASVESHRNARAALDIMQRDFAAARLVSYGPVTGAAAGTAASPGCFHYEMVNEPDLSAALGSAQNVPSITFTTVAGQSGLRSLYPAQDSQVALVRYTLEWTGVRSWQTNESSGVKELLPVYTLVKNVRLPNLQDRDVDMNEWGWVDGGIVDTATATVLNAQTVTNPNASTMWWNSGLAKARRSVRITSGSGKGQVRQIVASANGAYNLTVRDGFDPTPAPNDTYEIIPTITSEPLAFNVLTMNMRRYWQQPGDIPRWIDLDATKDFDPLPYMIEITLKMADQHIIKINTFTSRFYLPGSEE